MSTVSHVDDSMVSLIRELREEQKRLRVDQLADDVTRLSVNKTVAENFGCSQKKTKKAYVLEALEVWGKSKLLQLTMLL